MSADDSMEVEVRRLRCAMCDDARPTVVLGSQHRIGKSRRGPSPDSRAPTALVERARPRPPQSHPAVKEQHSSQACPRFNFTHAFAHSHFPS